ncbi:hypothetical protein [Terracoccus luteus]|uniref:Uncharacterized protein n=1 Tax=Terracoccus luteus TaxID=53356 RepID=A0A839PN87_9MICO|nr:hypothetical protein [Terracoccus luteus]MBB2985680.1 hypothetical protein [Terracoccus luteus]MCP2171332.1 hypothetical protein [Terracoccus luteus]
MDRLRQGVGDAFAVVVDGLRLAGRHLPVLLTLFLLGAAVRGAVIWAAVELSDEHPVAAQLLLPLAPIGTLAAIVFMLRALSPSLRHAGFGRDPGGRPDTGAGAPDRPRHRRLATATNRQLGLLASMLVPFLTVYSAQGLLEADRRQFVNSAAFAEFRSNADFFYGGSSGPNRFVLGGTAVIIGVVVVTFALRRLINGFDLASRSTGMGLFAAYVEIFWIFSVAAWATGLVDVFARWRDSRAFTVWVLDRWHAVVDVLGPVGVPLRTAVEWVVGLLADGTDLVVVPVAWLTVGAVAYGQSAALRGDSLRSVPLSMGLRRGDRGGRQATRTRAALRTARTRLPAPVRRLGRGATADLRERFGTFAQGVRLLVAAGLVPMLLFCIVFSVARAVEWGVSELIRVVRGPVDPSTGLAFAPWFSLVSGAAHTLLLVGLIAAAVDRIITRLPGGSTDVTPQPTAAPLSPRP